MLFLFPVRHQLSVLRKIYLCFLHRDVPRTISSLHCDFFGAVLHAGFCTCRMSAIATAQLFSVFLRVVIWCSFIHRDMADTGIPCRGLYDVFSHAGVVVGTVKKTTAPGSYPVRSKNNRTGNELGTAKKRPHRRNPMRSKNNVSDQTQGVIPFL